MAPCSARTCGGQRAEGPASGGPPARGLPGARVAATGQGSRGARRRRDCRCRCRWFSDFSRAQLPSGVGSGVAASGVMRGCIRAGHRRRAQPAPVSPLPPRLPVGRGAAAPDAGGQARARQAAAVQSPQAVGRRGEVRRLASHPGAYTRPLLSSS